MGLTRRIGILIAAIFFAVLLWGYVHLSGTYEVEMDLPLNVMTPQGYAISTDLPEKIHSRLSGPGWRMLALAYAKKSGLKIDLSERDTKMLPPKFYVTREELAASSSLPNDVKLVKIEPDSIAIELSPEISKRVPIVLRSDIEPASGFVVVGTPVITPSYITLRGSTARLDSLLVYPTKLLRSRGAHESFSQSVELSDTLTEELVGRSVTAVTVHVAIEAVAERMFKDIPVAVEALPADRELFLDPPNVAVTVRGGVDELAKLGPDAIKAKVVYDAISFDSLTSVIPMFDAPAGLEVLQSEPKELHFVVRKK